MIIWSLDPKASSCDAQRDLGFLLQEIRSRQHAQRCLPACQLQQLYSHTLGCHNPALPCVHTFFLIAVIDFCLTRTLVCDEDTNYQSLRLSWASKTSCDQRKGKEFVADTLRPQWSHGAWGFPRALF